MDEEDQALVRSKRDHEPWKGARVVDMLPYGGFGLVACPVTHPSQRACTYPSPMLQLRSTEHEACGVACITWGRRAGNQDPNLIRLRGNSNPLPRLLASANAAAMVRPSFPPCLPCMLTVSARSRSFRTAMASPSSSSSKKTSPTRSRPTFARPSLCVPSCIPHLGADALHAGTRREG